MWQLAPASLNLMKENLFYFSLRFIYLLIIAWRITLNTHTGNKTSYCGRRKCCLSRERMNFHNVSNDTYHLHCENLMQQFNWKPEITFTIKDWNTQSLNWIIGSFRKASLEYQTVAKITSHNLKIFRRFKWIVFYAWLYRQRKKNCTSLHSMFI